MCGFALGDVFLALEASWTTFVSKTRRGLCIILLLIVYLIKESIASCVLEHACFTQMKLGKLYRKKINTLVLWPKRWFGSVPCAQEPHESGLV